jgi:hypothetical protein
MKNPKQLHVEGKADQYAIASLMSWHVEWGSREKDWPVLICAAGSYSEMLENNYIPTLLQTNSKALSNIGFVIDADLSCEGRWDSLRRLCLPLFPDIPIDLPTGGLIVVNGDRRLGVWIMPDNSSLGMLETFIASLIECDDPDLWKFTKQASGDALDHNAKYKIYHLDKAHVHAWLAWQNPPGQPLGEAFLTKCLNAKHELAKPFINWFRELYEV